MLLTKVILKNYGVFSGETVFDLRCTSEKPIVLFGGKNGAGKTTLFESIILCLHGISFFEKKVTKKDYEKFLMTKIHRYLGTPASADFASITVEFEFFHQGKVDLYSVYRMWRNEDGKIVEVLSVMKNDNKLDSIEEEQWQPFVEELISPKISKLFFFDGEQITKMAEQNTEDIQIKDSFNNLLGLDLIKQLQADLRINMIRKMKGKEKEIEEKLASFESEKREVNHKIELLSEKCASLKTEIDQLEKIIASYESKISKLGGNYASKRDSLKTKREFLKVKLTSVEENIQHLCHHLLPFCLIPEHIASLKIQLVEDQELLKKQFEKEILEKNFDEIKSEVSSNDFWSELVMDGKLIEKITAKLVDIFVQNIQSKEYPNQNGMLNFSTLETAQILNQINEIDNVIPTKLEEHTEDFDEITDELQKIETALTRAPRDDEIGPIVSEMNSYYERLGILKTELEHVERFMTTDRMHLKIINHNIHKYIEETHESAKLHVNAKLSNKIQDVLEEYSQKLEIKKIEMLEKYLLQFIQILFHKENFITKVKIDEKTFEVTLYGENDIIIPKKLLSMGEKQMFATAVLWALGKTSGKPLPFMIDTPLARLDVKHRENLVERFFPAASHQVVIFSTDSEIDEKYYVRLAPFISKSYSMNYNSSKGKANVSEGYFWNKKGVKKVVTI